MQLTGPMAAEAHLAVLTLRGKPCRRAGCGASGSRFPRYRARPLTGCRLVSVCEERRKYCGVQSRLKLEERPRCGRNEPRRSNRLCQTRPSTRQTSPARVCRRAVFGLFPRPPPPATASRAACRVLQSVPSARFPPSSSHRPLCLVLTCAPALGGLPPPLP